ADADGVPRTPLKDLGISKATTDPANSPVAGAASPAPVAAVAPAPVVAAPVEAPAAPPAAPSAPPAAVEARVAEAVVEEPAAAAEVVDLPWEEPAPSLAAEPEPEP
ncbi:DNA polymerase III subunit gamma/tau, partial [Pseudomonas aeruginosa]